MTPSFLGGGSSTALPPAGDADAPAGVASPPPSTTTGCECDDSATWHDRYGPCQRPGCRCPKYRRKTNAAG